MTDLTKEKTVPAPTVAPAQAAPPPAPSAPAPVQTPSTRATHEAKKKRKKRIKNVIVFLIVVAIIATCVLMLRKYVFSKDEDMGELMTATVMRSSIQSMVEGSGTTKAKDSATVTPEAGGTILELFIQEGDMVTVGQQLYRMDATEAQDAVAKAQENVSDIEKQLADIYDSTKDLIIVAPHAGQLQEVAEFKLGDDVGKGTAIATLCDTTKLKMSLYFSYVYENDITTGQTVEVSIPSTMTTGIVGTVETINKVHRVVPEGSVLFEAIVVLDNPGTLTKDMEATASLTTASGEAVFPYSSAKLEFYQTTKIVSKAVGPVEAVHLLNYGDVKAGDLLVQLGAKDNNKEISEKKEALKTAQKTLDDAVKKLGNYNAVATIAGTVLSCSVKEGVKVEAGQGITIADTSVMTVEISVDERNIQYVKAGMMVNLDQWGTPYMGTVDTISQTAKAENGVASFPVIVKVDNMDGTLMSNTYVQYNFVASQADNCLVVPVQAVQYVSFTNTAPIGEEGGDGGMTDDGGMLPEDGGMTDDGVVLPEDGGTDVTVPEDDGTDASIPAAVPDAGAVPAEAMPASSQGGFKVQNLMMISGGSISVGGGGGGMGGGGMGGGGSEETGTIVYVQGSGEKFDVPPENAIEPDPTWEVPEGFFPVKVSIGLADTMNVEITDGLSEGQTVFVTYMKQNANNYGW